MKLTKEILTELGWVYLSGFFWELPWNTDCDEVSNRGLSWRLNFSAPDKSLHIDCYERNAFEWERAYMGPCSTKEELITLMALLRLGNKSELYTEKPPRPWTDNTGIWDRIVND